MFEDPRRLLEQEILTEDREDHHIQKFLRHYLRSSLKSSKVLILLDSRVQETGRKSRKVSSFETFSRNDQRSQDFFDALLHFSYGMRMFDIRGRGGQSLYILLDQMLRMSEESRGMPTHQTRCCLRLISFEK